MKNTDLYDRLGGHAAVNAAVDLFYSKVLADDRVSFIFEGINMDNLLAHQKAFMIYAFGGTPYYSGKSLREGHAHLVKKFDLNDTHFNAVTENLLWTLQQMRVKVDMIGEIMAIVESTRNEVLNK